MAEHEYSHEPRLDRVGLSGVTVLTDTRLRDRHGVLIAFTERTGGVSDAPFESLNLAAHVGDDPAAVDENRKRLLDALGLGDLREDLVMAEQVHGDRVYEVTRHDTGAGAHAGVGDSPIEGTDALLTTARRMPLLMCFADCVPVVLVAVPKSRTPGIAIVHAGWKGALAGLPGKTAYHLIDRVGCAPTEVLAYIGPHVASCCYNVDARRISLFNNMFDTIAAVGDGLDLSAAVKESLGEAGIAHQAVAETGLCTSDHTERFYSYRAAKVTGRHGAIAAIA